MQSGENKQKCKNNKKLKSLYDHKQNMASIFDLKTSFSELSSANTGSSRNEYDQISASRDVTLDNFSNGPIELKWDNNSTQWWVPSRSYCRIRCQLSREDGAHLVLADGISPNMSLAANLFASMELKFNGKIVSRIGDYVPQVDALENRLVKSDAWLKSVGASVNFWNEDFTSRILDVSSDGSDEVKSEVETARLALGVGATQQLAIAVDTGVVTQSVDTAVPFTDLFVAGDSIRITTPKGPTLYQIVSVQANTMQLDDVKTLAVAAAVYPWSRVRMNVSKPDKSRKLISFELCWVPPLSLMKIQHAIPAGKFELRLVPQPKAVIQKYCIESLLGAGDKIPNTGTLGVPSAGSEFKFQVVDFYYYLNKVEGPRVTDATYLIDLESTSCQSKTVKTKSFQQNTFNVSGSTYALTVAFQDNRAGQDSQISSSKFKSYDAGVTQSEELKVERFYIKYAGVQKPSPDGDPLFVVGETDYTLERYMENIISTGGMFSEGGAESHQSYLDRGMYYYFDWPRDGSDRSTDVLVKQQFNGSTDIDNMNVLLFSHIKQVARVTIQNGELIDMVLEDA